MSPCALPRVGFFTSNIELADSSHSFQVVNVNQKIEIFKKRKGPVIIWLFLSSIWCIWKEEWWECFQRGLVLSSEPRCGDLVMERLTLDCWKKTRADESPSDLVSRDHTCSSSSLVEAFRVVCVGACQIDESGPPWKGENTAAGSAPGAIPASHPASCLSQQNAEL